MLPPVRLQVSHALYREYIFHKYPFQGKILDQRGVIGSLVSLAESCPHLAIAGTAYYALGLVATTAPGSEVSHTMPGHTIPC